MFKHIQHIIVWNLLCLLSMQGVAQMAMPDTVCVGTTKTYSVNAANPPGSTYTWKIGGVPQTTTTNQINVTWNTPGVFLVEVQQHAGCDGNIQSGTVTVKSSFACAIGVASAISVPKAFSPNGDGHNDRLLPLLFRIKELYYFRVFNRWGQRVFETRTPGEGWDGTFNGVPSAPDIYTWTVAGVGSDGRTHNTRGQTVLFR
jgi:gliding motility-associated-like protein